MIDFQEINRIIQQYNNIVIYRHINSDYDAYGSQLGLKHILLANYPDKNIYSIGKDDINNPDFLEEMDNPDDDIISESLAIIVDTSNIARVEGDSYTLAMDSIRIDHHPFVEEICNQEIIDTDASSASQLVLEFALNNKLSIPKNAAEWIYGGILTDTQSLTIDKVDYRLFADIAELLKVDFKVQDVVRQVYDVDKDTFAAQTYLRSQIKFEKDTAYMFLTQQQLRQHNLTVKMAKDSVDLMNSIKGVAKYGVFVQTDADEYTISLRSHYITISDIAIKYGGGGHLLASGISSVTKNQAKEILKMLIDKE